MKHVLILTGDAGAGHMLCSNSLKSAFKKRDKSTNVEIVDIYQFSPRGQVYDWVMSAISKSSIAMLLYDFFYKLIDKYEGFAKIAYFFILQRFEKPTLALIKEKNPDLVVVNNPLTAAVVTKCREVHPFNYIVTVTDIGSSIVRWWASHNADLTFSPSKMATEKILSDAPGSEVVTGYYSLVSINRPTNEQRKKDREDFCQTASFNEADPIVLVTGCGNATLKVLRGIKQFIEKSNYQFIILTGKDAKLENTIKKKYERESRIFIQGYTNKIITLFSIADVVISKPGPSTLLEIEKLGQKGIFTQATGYQEYGNIEYLLQNPNFVYVGSNYNLVPKKVEEFLGKERVEYYGTMKDAEDVVEYIYTQYQPMREVQTRSVLKPMRNVA